MSSVPSTEKKKLPWLRLAILGVILCAGAVLVLRGVDVKGLKDQVFALIREAGPVAFFAGMAVLPALGAPLMAFTIPAGEAFAGSMGLSGVIAVALVALAFGLALAYWMARYALRPLLTRLITQYGYTIPRVTKDNALTVALLVRLTPGPPFVLQCYLLGLAEVPFKMYMIVSWVCITPWVIGAIVLGQGILNGNFKIAAIGIAVLAGAVVLVQWLRKKFIKSRDIAG